MSRCLVILICCSVMGCQSSCPNSECEDCVPANIYSNRYHHQTIDNWNVKLTARHCATKFLNEYRQSTDQVLSEDFQDGFQQSWIDIAMGRPATVPPVPPPRYWHTYYRSPSGMCMADEWFAGYELGLESAGISTISRMNRIAISPLAPDLRYGGHSHPMMLPDSHAPGTALPWPATSQPSMIPNTHTTSPVAPVERNQSLPMDQHMKTPAQSQIPGKSSFSPQTPLPEPANKLEEIRKNDSSQNQNQTQDLPVSDRYMPRNYEQVQYSTSQAGSRMPATQHTELPRRQDVSAPFFPR